MIQWFHNYIPQPILFQWNWLSVHWYGLIIAAAIIVGYIITARFTSKNNFSRKLWGDMLFYSVISGLVGARLYHVILELPYYFRNPIGIFEVWHGGLAIHGAIIGGGLAVYYFSRKHNWQYTKVLDILVMALLLGQAFGRWGNYFNQELFGMPTNLSWGIFIEMANRPAEYLQYNYFHPTFLYEFVANILLFIFLLMIYRYKNKIAGLTASVYLVGYGIIRFCLEFLRIDRTPEVAGLRWPQWASIIIVLLVAIYWFKLRDLQKLNKPV